MFSLETGLQVPGMTESPAQMALNIYPVPTCVSSLGDPPKGGPCCPLCLRRDYAGAVYRGYGWHLDVQDPGATLLEFVSQGWEEGCRPWWQAGWASFLLAALFLRGVPRSQNPKLRSVLPSHYEGVFVEVRRAYFT